MSTQPRIIDSLTPLARAVEAVVMLGDSVVDVIHVEPDKGRASISLGTSHDADIHSAHAPAALLPLVARQGKTMVVRVPRGLYAELRAQGQAHSVQELIDLRVARPVLDHAGGVELTVPEHGSVIVHLGPARVFIRSVAVERARPGLLPARLDGRMARFAGVSMLAHLAVLAFLATIPPEPGSLSLDLGSQEARLARIRSKPSESLVREPVPDASDASDAAARPYEVRTSMNDPAQARPGTPRPRGPSSAPRTRDQAILDAVRTGINDLLPGSDAFGDLAQAAGEFGEGGDLLAFHLAMDGDGDGGGSFGDSARDVSPWPGIIPAGSYKTTCDTSGDQPCLGTSWGEGSRSGPELSMRRGERRRPVVDAPRPVVDGGIDSAIIRRHIKSKLARIEHCYERELMQSPELDGTVTSEFLIDGRGAVIHASARGMGNSRLESCVADIIESIQFPRSADQSSVKVTYPFHFRRAG